MICSVLLIISPLHIYVAVVGLQHLPPVAPEMAREASVHLQETAVNRDSRSTTHILDQTANTRIPVAGDHAIQVPPPGFTIKSEAPLVGLPAPVNGGNGTAQAETSQRGSRTLDVGGVNALVHLRTIVSESVNAERMRLQAARHDAEKTVSNVRRRLAEEWERLKFIERKVREKSDSHDRAAAEFQRARDVLEAAKFDEGMPATKEQKISMKSFTKICENLVASWLENAGHAHSRLQAWEFKHKRQSERVEKSDGGSHHGPRPVQGTTKHVRNFS